MTTYTASFLSLASPGGIVFRRWQSRWDHTEVTWEEQPWQFVDFGWSSLGAGGLAGLGSLAMTFPCLPSLHRDLSEASYGRHRALLRVFHYPEEDDGPTPPESMILVGAFSGVIGITSITENTISAEVVHTLGAPGGMLPPRIAITSVIGSPCSLEV